jgi:hypothetical protein
VAEACTNHMYCGLEINEGQEARKHRTYSAAKCTIVDYWFSVNENSFDTSPAGGRKWLPRGQRGSECVMWKPEPN